MNEMNKFIALDGHKRVKIGKYILIGNVAQMGPTPISVM